MGGIDEIANRRTLWNKQQANAITRGEFGSHLPNGV
jgi:hypothetical protein